MKDLLVKGRPSLRAKPTPTKTSKPIEGFLSLGGYPVTLLAAHCGTVASRSLIYFICNMTLSSPLSQVGCEWGAEISILSPCTAASLVPDDCQPPNRHGLTVSKLCTALTRAGPHTQDTN